MPYNLPCLAPTEGITGRQKAHKSILRNDPNSNHERSGAMTGMEVFTTVLGIGGTVCAIVFGYIAFRRNNKSDDTAEGKKDGVLLTEIGYIKSGVDDIKRKQEKEDGRIVATVPNIDLQTDGEIDVYRYIYDPKGNRTIWADKLTVLPRERPDDYVYSETPVKTWNELDSRIKSLEETVATELPVKVAQPDWNQNNEAAPDYVKNRPGGYISDPLLTTVWSGTLASSLPAITPVFEIALGQKFYIAIDNGELIEYTAETYQEGGITAYTIGTNSLSDIASGKVKDGFAIYYHTATGSPACSGIAVGSYVGKSCSINIIKTTPVKFDVQYLPIADDNNFGVVKKSELVEPYIFDMIAPYNQMVEAIKKFENGRAVIMWHGIFVIGALYNKSDDSIQIRFANEPTVVEKFSKLTGSDDPAYCITLGELQASELYATNIRDAQGEIIIDQQTLYLKSSTEGSSKKFKITVDDAGTLTATEVTTS